MGGQIAFELLEPPIFSRRFHAMTALIQRGLEIVPGYTLVRRLGSGMAGEVWVARASGGVYVAIKIIRDMSMVGSRRELGALRIVREVKHTNLCPLIGVWFVDSQGELLSSSATDDILGRESSLIDTEHLTGGDNSDDLRETHEVGAGDQEEPPPVAYDPAATIDTSDVFPGMGLSGSTHTWATGATPDGRSSKTDAGSARPQTAGDRRNEEDPDGALGDARQMIIVMGLGEKTLNDRLIEMRAPDNAPAADDDPMHLPGGLPAPELLRYLIGAASAIDELNLRHNIYHCDIKPQNILIVGGNAQVCDFGLARRVHESRRTQLAIGTPAYGAPEMLFDQTYTKTIDQYSLAVTYYEMRTGELPFETSRRSSFLRAKANGELKLDLLPLRERGVIERATLLDPDARYPSCGEFAEALEAAVYAKETPVGNRHRRAMIASTLVAGLLAMGVLGVYQIGWMTSDRGGRTAPPILPAVVSAEKIDEIPAETTSGSKTEIPSEIPSEVPSETATLTPDRMTESDSVDSGQSMREVAKAEIDLPSVTPEIMKVEIESDEKPDETDNAKDSLPEMSSIVPQRTPPEPQQPPPPTLTESIRARLAMPSERIPFDQHRSWQTELDQAGRTDQEPAARTEIAETQMLLLVSLRQRRDETPADAPELLKISAALVSDLDQTAADRRNGWQRVDSPIGVKAHTVAGLVAWEDNRVSAALSHWIEIQKSPDLLTQVPAKWRFAVANGTLDWLIESSGVDDRNTDQVRYAKLTKRGAGVLDLADAFASDSPEIMQRITPERFLLAASLNDFRGSTQYWDAMQLAAQDARRTPQLAYALWQTTTLELKPTTAPARRIDLTGKLIEASIGLLDTAETRLLERLGVAIHAVSKLTDRPADGLPVVPESWERPNLVVLCERYVEMIRAAESPIGHPALLDRFDQVELAAAIAAQGTAAGPNRSRLALIAAEAFVQFRYEEVDDRPIAESIGRLDEYERLSKQAEPNRATTEQVFLAGRVADQKGFLGRDKTAITQDYEQARQAYSQVIDKSGVPDDLKGSAYRCRASLLSRMAAVESGESQRELLDRAAKDAAAALALPPRWHGDHDDRFTTAAEVNVSMVRLLTALDLTRKQELLDDADRYLDEAITVREQLGYPTHRQETQRLNGYLFDLLKSPRGLRRSDREQRAMTLMSQLATERIANAKAEGLERTIDSMSVRGKVHWHSMCAMVHQLAAHPEIAMSHIRYALDLATERLPDNDDRRHRAVLIYVQFRGDELMRAAQANGRPDQSLVKELSDLLDTIVDPNPHFQSEKQGFVRELTSMKRK